MYALQKTQWYLIRGFLSKYFYTRHNNDKNRLKYGNRNIKQKNKDSEKFCGNTVNCFLPELELLNPH